MIFFYPNCVIYAHRRNLLYRDNGTRTGTRYESGDELLQYLGLKSCFQDNVSGEACLPAEFEVFLQTESCIQDNTNVCQQTQVTLLLCLLPVIMNCVLGFKCCDRFSNLCLY